MKAGAIFLDETADQNNFCVNDYYVQNAWADIFLVISWSSLCPFGYSIKKSEKSNQVPRTKQDKKDWNWNARKVV